MAATKLLGAAVLLVGIGISALIVLEQRGRRRERIWYFTASESPHLAGHPADWVPYLEACTLAIGHHATALRPCLGRAAPSREEDGVIMMRFTIDADGTASALDASGTELDPSCAETAFQELRFAAPPGGASIQVRCPYHLVHGATGELKVSAPRSWTQAKR